MFKNYPMLSNYLIASLSIFLSMVFGTQLFAKLNIDISKYPNLVHAALAAVFDVLLSMVFLGMKSMNYMDMVYTFMVYYISMLMLPQVQSFVAQYVNISGYNMGVYLDAGLTSLLGGVFYLAFSCLGKKLLPKLKM